MPQSLEPLEPYGSGNPQPLLWALQHWSCGTVVPVGGGNHLRLVCAKKGAMLTCMCFGVKPEEFPFVPGETLDLAVTLEAREFRGEAQLTVSVREAKLSGLDMDQCIHTYRVYEKLQRGEALSREEGEELLPTRQDLAALYRKLASLKGVAFGLQSLLGALPGFNLGKLLTVPGNAAGAAAHCFAGRGAAQDRGAAAHPRESGYLRLPGLRAGQTAGRKLTEG